MRKTREICRLNHVRLPGRAIARAVGVSNSTVSDVLSRLRAADLDWSAGGSFVEIVLSLNAS